MHAHLSGDEFLTLGNDFLSWIRTYLDDVETRPIGPCVAPGDVRRALPAEPPRTGEDLANVFKDLDSIIAPGLTHWQHPSWFAYFPCNHSYPSILGELVSAGLGIQGMLWETSPACTELESHLMDWMLDAFGLPEKFRTAPRDDPGGQCVGGGVIQDTASSGVLCALVAARDRATAGAASRDGLQSCPPLVAYTSDQAHSSVEKACSVTGLGRSALRLIETDDEFRMDPHRLVEAMAEDKAAGRVPFFVSATAGTTACGAVDPTRAIAEICKKHGAWLHLDAAMFGAAAVAEEYRWVLDGAEECDSICINAHKWLFTNFDCDLFWVADRTALTSSLGVMPEYLRNQATETGGVIDYRDWQIPLGRRFRALKLWFVLRHYGLDGLADLVREHIAMAQEFADMIDADENLRRVAPSLLSLVCIKHKDGDDATKKTMDTINATGKAKVTHAKLNGDTVIRVSIGQSRTTLAHVANLYSMLCEAARGTSTTTSAGQ
jgi:aromatic-L-amino-acid decarboxylase